MKKIVLMAAIIAMSASFANALTIVGSKHDLSSGAGTSANYGADEICIYCHTPHNPVQNVPLWNRNNPTNTGWTFYNSASLTNVSKALVASTNFQADSISLFCMSCHDGVTGLGNISKKAGHTMDTSTPIAIGSAGIIGSGASGKTLTNDHPVGMNYDSVVAEKPAAFNNKALAQAMIKNGTAFFGAGYMECASCHIVHDNVNTKFLRTGNKNSQLCLACHNK